jgi:hypothetical protein
VLESTQGIARELDFDGWKPCPSGGGMLVVQQEEVHHCLVVVVVCAVAPGDSSMRSAVAVADVVGAAQTVFGYPNEEAYWKDPRELGHGFYEILESPWRAALQRYNLATFGKDLSYPPAMRHFFIGSKDVSFQALAQDLRVTIERQRPFDEVAAEAFSRIGNWVTDELRDELLRNAKHATAAEWRSHRVTLEDWRGILTQWLAATPADATQLRESLFARLPAAEDALAASGSLHKYRPQPLSLQLEALERLGPRDTQENARFRLVYFLDRHIFNLEIAEQNAARCHSGDQTAS